MFSSTANSSLRQTFTPSFAASPTFRPTQANYVDKHTHNCDTQHIAIGTGPELTGLKIEFVIGDEKVVVESPMGVNIPAGTPHCQRIIEGSGHFFNFVPKPNYNDGLV